jgi:hypothetical protein
MLSDLAVSRCRGARAGEQHPRDAPCPVTRQIANDFTTPHRITDQRNIAKVELLDHSGQIAGERVEIAASPGILGSSVTAPIIGDAAQPLLGQFVQLIFPYIGVQPPGMAKHHGASAPPIAIKQSGAIARLNERSRMRRRLGRVRRGKGWSTRRGQRRSHDTQRD